MPIQTTCPSCRTVYTLADHYVGKTVRCRECEAPIVVRAAKERARDDEDESNSGARERIQTRPRAGSPADRGSPMRTRPRRRESEDEWDSEDSAQHSNRGLVIGLIAAGVGLVLLLGVGMLVVVLVAASPSADTPSGPPVNADAGNRPRPRPPGLVVDADQPPNVDPVAKALQQLKSADPNQRREAARELKDMLPDERRAEVVQALGPLLNDGDFFTRLFAVQALGVWGNKDAVPLLLKAMQDKKTRDEAMKALGRLKDERAAEPIAARLEELFDRHAAEEALKLMGPVAEKAVLARLSHHDWMVRMSVCDILAVIGTKQSIPALEKAIAAGQGIRAGANRLVAPRAEQAIKAIKARQ